jgi:integrase
MESLPLDAAGHRRSPATMPGYHHGRPPRNKGEQYPADPPTIEEIIAVMRIVGDRADGDRLQALIVLLWRAGLRISEALSLRESDLDRSRGAVLVRRGKGGKRREVGMDRWAWDHLNLGLRSVASYRSAHCSVSFTDRPRDGTGKHQPHVSNYTTQPSQPVSAVGSRHANSGTHTRSRWRTRVCRWS